MSNIREWLWQNWSVFVMVIDLWHEAKSMAAALPIQLAIIYKAKTWQHEFVSGFRALPSCFGLSQVFTSNILCFLATTTGENNSKRSATEVTINWAKTNIQYLLCATTRIQTQLTWRQGRWWRVQSIPPGTTLHPHRRWSLRPACSLGVVLAH